MGYKKKDSYKKKDKLLKKEQGITPALTLY